MMEIESETQNEGGSDRDKLFKNKVVLCRLFFQFLDKVISLTNIILFYLSH